MAAGVAGVLLEAPADDSYSPPIPDLIRDYQQYLFSPPLSHLLCGLVFCLEEYVFGRLFSGVYVSRRHIPPDEINYYRHSGKSRGDIREVCGEWRGEYS